jgi:hypothetical protein
MIPQEGDDSLGAPGLLVRKDLISLILRLQAEGWKRALAKYPELDSSKDEPYMNGRLFQGMLDEIKGLNLRNIYVFEEAGVRSDDDLAEPDGKPDGIVVLMELGTIEPHAIIECKRVNPLEISRDLRGRYVRFGIDRFINELYGAGHVIDFMVAYVLDGDDFSALTDVNDYLSNVGRESCHLRQTGEFAMERLIGESTHTRVKSRQPFRLFHQFLVFPEVYEDGHERPLDTACQTPSPHADDQGQSLGAAG